MLEPVSVGLKFGFLVILYLFLVWIVRSSLRELRRTSPRAAGTAAPEATGIYRIEDGFTDGAPQEPHLLVDRAPGHDPGVIYDIGEHATLGRGDVEIRFDDPFASLRHARIARQGQIWVLEDLGSTNGTFLNDQRLEGPMTLHPGDRVRIGDSEFIYALP